MASSVGITYHLKDDILHVTTNQQYRKQPTQIFLNGHSYNKVDVVIEPDVKAAGFCHGCVSVLKVVGLALAILASTAAIAAGVTLGLAAADISIWGSAAYAVPAIELLGTTWSYVAAASLTVLGFTGFVGGNVSACN